MFRRKLNTNAVITDRANLTQTLNLEGIYDEKEELLKQKVLITKRDEDVLRGLFEHKILDMNCIWRKYYADVTEDIPRRRLTKLYEGGYVWKSAIIRDGSFYVGFSATKKGVEGFEYSYPYEIGNKDVRSNSHEHDIELFKLRNRFEQLSVFRKYFTESMLQNCPVFKRSEEYSEFSKARSDGLLTFLGKTENINSAIEYEASEKAYSRYHSKFMDYYVSRNVHFVFYVCETPKLMEIIFATDAKIIGKSQTKIFAALKSDVLSDSSEIIFRGHDKSRVVLK